MTRCLDCPYLDAPTLRTACCIGKAVADSERVNGTAPGWMRAQVEADQRRERLKLPAGNRAERRRRSSINRRKGDQ